jgi:hypothetical protein
VQRQLRAGKVALCRDPAAVAGVFAVGKQGSGRLREVWNGRSITEAAARPPKPPLQANPAALAELEASAERPLWMSGRDARVFFDQLMAPTELRRWFGRPAVALAELARGELFLTLDELDRFVGDHRSLAPSFRLTPVSTAWPMGFGWSSFVAQSFMVSCCRDAGFSDSQMLTEEGKLPPSHL